MSAVNVALQKRFNTSPCVSRLKQSGIALVASLVLLMVLILLGVTAMNTTTLQEKMAINMQQSFNAFHVAESARNSILLNVGSVYDNFWIEFDPADGKPLRRKLPDITVGGITAKLSTVYLDDHASKRSPGKHANSSLSNNNWTMGSFEVSAQAKVGAPGAEAVTTIKAGTQFLHPKLD